eukprot:TRINITY_DN4321_c0_g1_i1.p1 TRINITY_DN4321_c0_g1~~TRINITY_DN4321_c0_g1_i1.p1  ORF type:complete len:409 (+),score=100.54 TRINITY_DN4321_c0_g1_i1:86-1312(+)
MATTLHPLLSELQKVVNELAEYNQDNRKDESLHLQTKYHRCLARLCYMLERILEHGIRDTALFGTTHFWSYLEQLDRCLPGPEVKDVLRKVKECSKGNIGRGRVFLRLTLNEGSLVEYLRALMWNPQLTGSSYRETAILRDDEQSTAFLTVLESLQTFKFSFLLKDKDLDEADYWERHLARKPTSNTATAISSDSMLAPANLTEIPKANGVVPSIEAITCIIEQTEAQEKELQEAGKKILNLKVQVQKERSEKEIALSKNRQLDDELKKALQKIRDLENTLSFYKSADMKLLSEDLQNFDLNAAMIEEQRRLQEMVDPLFRAAKNEYSEEFASFASKAFSTMPEGDSDIHSEEDDNRSQELKESAEHMMKRLNEASVRIQEMKSYDEGIKQKLLRIPSQSDINSTAGS